MVRVEWQYSQFKNIARSSHFIPGPYFIHTQSAVCSPQSTIHSPWSVVRSPWSAVRSPQFAADLKRSTWLRCVRIMLQGYNKSILISEKTIRLFLWKRRDHDTGKLWIAVGVAFPPETARRRLLHYKTTAILFAVTPLPLLPSPTRHSYIWSVFNFFFLSNTKIKKRFSFRISSSLILFPAVSLHMNSFVKFEFLISWNLWNRKLKIQF